MNHVDVTSYHPLDDEAKIPDEPIVMRCVECDDEVEITDLDTHAKNAHKSSHLRTFVSEAAYVTWKKEQP